MSTRGEHLVRADRRFATGGGLVARLLAPAFARVLDEIDRRLMAGGIIVTLPNGLQRRLGFRAGGPEAIVHLASWLALGRLATSGSVGWYKAWALGEWSSPNPVKIFEVFSKNAMPLGNVGRAKGPFRWINALAHRNRDNAPRKARENIAAHYDLGNDFYAAWLDASMTYSAATWDQPSSLETAQYNKMRLILDRLAIKPGDRVLEIGCGWGSLAMQAAWRGANVVGLTLSTEQKEWAEASIAEAGLSDRIEIRLQDYRDIDESFDAVVSVEMVEAVGERWWPAYLDAIARNLKPGGRAALQYIYIRPELFDSYSSSADFIQTYIFPGGSLIHEPRFRALAEYRGLRWENRGFDFGSEYAETLRLWRLYYDEAIAAGKLAGFGQEFHQLWRYYLMYCEGGFRGGAIDVAQVTMVRREVG